MYINIARRSSYCMINNSTCRSYEALQTWYALIHSGINLSPVMCAYDYMHGLYLLVVLCKITNDHIKVKMIIFLQKTI